MDRRIQCQICGQWEGCCKHTSPSLQPPPTSWARERAERLVEAIDHGWEVFMGIEGQRSSDGMYYSLLAKEEHTAAVTTALEEAAARGRQSLITKLEQPDEEMLRAVHSRNTAKVLSEWQRETGLAALHAIATKLNQEENT